MRREPKPTLDYSSPAQEQLRERSAEERRRAALENYNESTFGERRPIASALVRFALAVVVAAVLAWLLPQLMPRRSARLVLALLALAFVVWEARREGWTFGGWGPGGPRGGWW